LERYWYDTLEHDLYYYFIEPNSTEFSQIREEYNRDDPNAVEPDYQEKQFRKDFTKRALKDRKAIQATKLLLNAFSRSTRYIQDSKEYFKEIVADFLPVFRRAAEVSPGGRIPLQWVLDEIKAETPEYQEEDRKFDSDAWEVAIANKDVGPPIIPLTAQDYADRYRNGHIMNGYKIVDCPDDRISESDMKEYVYVCEGWRWNEDDYHKYLSENKFTKQKKYWLNSLKAYILPWNVTNYELYDTMAPLAELYKQYPELFTDDTEDEDDADMGMVLMNYPGLIA